MRRFIFALVVTGFGLLPAAVAAETTVQPLRSMDSAAATGYTMLVRKPESLLARVQTAEQVAGQELWWLVFNNPAACSSSPCQLNDIYTSNTRADLIQAKSHTLKTGAASEFCLTPDTIGRSMMPELGLTAFGLKDIQSAEIHLIVTTALPGLATTLQRSNADFSRPCVAGECGVLNVAVHRSSQRLQSLASLGLASSSRN